MKLCPAGALIPLPHGQENDSLDCHDQEVSRHDTFRSLGRHRAHLHELLYDKRCRPDSRSVALVQQSRRQCVQKSTLGPPPPRLQAPTSVFTRTGVAVRVPVPLRVRAEGRNRRPERQRACAHDESLAGQHARQGAGAGVAVAAHARRRRVHCRSARSATPKTSRRATSAGSCGWRYGRPALWIGFSQGKRTGR